MDFNTTALMLFLISAVVGSLHIAYYIGCFIAKVTNHISWNLEARDIAKVVQHRYRMEILEEDDE